MLNILIHFGTYLALLDNWYEAYEAGCAPNLILEATNIKTLDYVSFENLSEYKA
jgi:uncharacterized protein (DUF2237 family)